MGPGLEGWRGAVGCDRREAIKVRWGRPRLSGMSGHEWHDGHHAWPQTRRTHVRPTAFVTAAMDR